VTNPRDPVKVQEQTPEEAAREYRLQNTPRCMMCSQGGYTCEGCLLWERDLARLLTTREAALRAEIERLKRSESEAVEIIHDLTAKLEIADRFKDDLQSKHDETCLAYQYQQRLALELDQMEERAERAEAQLVALRLCIVNLYPPDAVELRELPGDQVTHDRYWLGWVGALDEALAAGAEEGRCQHGNFIPDPDCGCGV